ncbi:alpha/beta hydrolase [Maribacter dokdonensis]|uniref:alpha/beta hydrolase n=1 Tax=Maribacter dokdonensis TaxID=320912 RepID=UPI002AB06F47|nr:alpha/beta hydrolase-fold protein [Maribacter dokdonensis]
MQLLRYYRDALCIIIMCILPITNILCQEHLIISEKIEVNSMSLKENRALFISLPKSYNDTIYSEKNYPVLYFFDGDSHIENLVAQHNWLTRNLYSTMPELILVGIVQNDRTKELTPSKMATPKEWKRANFSSSGGNAEFMEFIENELKPMINKKYRTNGFEILSGHSFGGLATMHCFVNTPSLYNAYIAIDPSIWWNNAKILKDMDSNWFTKEHTGKLLFVAKANDPGSGEDHHNGLLELHEKLNALNGTENFIWEYKFYNNEDHGSVVIPAEYDAFRYIFKGYQMPVKKIMKNPSLLDSHYDNISQRLNYTVVPDEALIDQLSKVCTKQELYSEAAELLLKNSKNYPNSRAAKKSYENFIHKYKPQLTP